MSNTRRIATVIAGGALLMVAGAGTVDALATEVARLFVQYQLEE